MSKTTDDKTVVYNDLFIRIAGSLLISYIIDSLGRPESFFQKITRPFFYVDLVSGFLMVIAVWEFIRRTILYLDKRFDWFGQTVVRLLVQTLMSVVLPAVLSFGLTFLYMRFMWQQDIFETEWLYNEFFVVVIIIVFINFYYFTFWLYRQKETAPYTTGSIELNPVNIDSGSPVLQALHEPVQNVIEVTKGGKIELIPPSDIALIYLKDGYCYIKKFDKESFLTTYALDDLFELLNAEEFFRANRQTIINRRACLAYGSIENGKIELEASAFSSEKIIISQKRAKAFRQWIGKR